MYPTRYYRPAKNNGTLAPSYSGAFGARIALGYHTLCQSLMGSVTLHCYRCFAIVTILMNCLWAVSAGFLCCVILFPQY